MSVLFDFMFAALGALAVGAIAMSFRGALAPLADLRAALRQPVPTEEVRLTLREHRVLARIPRSPLRHHRGPKPVTHRLGGLSPRRAAA
ncbi:hypothetical protein [Novosphingobium sp. JCM 18896]|uniref:hypothetical protein n=1 Tax=Novosphingobium sp. JCM 18896 TaxID=2989731 RepID=UPI002221E7C6|nr:hypothetical protein [Novosphingobium sp. JCM 18896]MCW1428079.1 hypothetical protein [Novosphingobium sp. JCM 18896]